MGRFRLFTVVLPIIVFFHRRGIRGPAATSIYIAPRPLRTTLLTAHTRTVTRVTQKTLPAHGV